MSRCLPLVVLAAVLAPLPCPAAERPNIIVILSDDKYYYHRPAAEPCKKILELLAKIALRPIGVDPQKLRAIADN